MLLVYAAPAEHFLMVVYIYIYIKRTYINNKCECDFLPALKKQMNQEFKTIAEEPQTRPTIRKRI